MIRGIKEALQMAYFKRFPALASVTREYRQGATKTHRSSFGLSLVGPEYLIDSSFEQDEIRLVTELLSEVDTFVDVGANIGINAVRLKAEQNQLVAVLD